MHAYWRCLVAMVLLIAQGGWTNPMKAQENTSAAQLWQGYDPTALPLLDTGVTAPQT